MVGVYGAVWLWGSMAMDIAWSGLVWYTAVLYDVMRSGVM